MGIQFYLLYHFMWDKVNSRPWVPFSSLKVPKYAKNRNRGVFSVLPVGIEPTLQAPQACVLSIERREPYYALLYSRASKDKRG